MSAPGIKQQTGPLTLLFLFSQYGQITFWFWVETYICVGNSGPFQNFNWTGIFLQYNYLYFKYDVLCLFVLLIVPQRPEISTWWCTCNASSLRNSTDNNRACLSPSNARPVPARPVFSSIDRELKCIRWLMTRCSQLKDVWLMTIPPATLQVTQKHCICN